MSETNREKALRFVASNWVGYTHLESRLQAAIRGSNSEWSDFTRQASIVREHLNAPANQWDSFRQLEDDFFSLTEMQGELFEDPKNQLREAENLHVTLYQDLSNQPVPFDAMVTIDLAYATLMFREAEAVRIVEELRPAVASVLNMQDGDSSDEVEDEEGSDDDSDVDGTF